MKTLLHACKYFLGLEAPESNVTPGELRCLLKYCEKAEVSVEIGCYEGKTTVALAKQSQGLVYSIDPFLKGRLGVSYGEWIAKSYCRRLAVHNVRLIKMYSHDAVEEFVQPIDFLFIDADHSYEAAKRDWHDWFPKVRDGGTIALHDCRIARNSPDHLGTMRLYSEYLQTIPEVREIDAIDSLAVFHKSAAPRTRAVD